MFTRRPALIRQPLGGIVRENSTEALPLRFFFSVSSVVTESVCRSWNLQFWKHRLSSLESVLTQFLTLKSFKIRSYAKLPRVASLCRQKTFRRFDVQTLPLFSAIYKSLDRKHRFASPLSSTDYESLFPQLSCFHIYTKRRGCTRVLLQSFNHYLRDLHAYLRIPLR